MFKGLNALYCAIHCLIIAIIFFGDGIKYFGNPILAHTQTSLSKVGLNLEGGLPLLPDFMMQWGNLLWMCTIN